MVLRTAQHVCVSVVQWYYAQHSMCVSVVQWYYVQHSMCVSVLVCALRLLQRKYMGIRHLVSRCMNPPPPTHSIVFALVRQASVWLGRDTDYIDRCVPSGAWQKHPHISR